MHIIEILLPKGTSDRGLSPRQAQKIDALQKRMDSYVDKIMDPSTSIQGKEFLKSRLRDDYYELKDLLPHVHAVAENNHINEVLNEPVDWRWTHTGRDECTAVFRVGNLRYGFRASDDNDTGSWDIIFKPIDQSIPNSQRYKVLGTGNASSVFSTIVDIMKSFLSFYKYSIQSLTFTVEELSREKLYKHMIQRLLPDWNLEDDNTNFTLTLPNKSKETQTDNVMEAVHKVPITTKDFDAVKEMMNRPIPAAVARIYIQDCFVDDEFNDELTILEDTEPDRDVRPLIAEWFKRVMPDQLFHFTDEKEEPSLNQQMGILSPIHGYDPKMYKGTNDPFTGDAYGRL